MQDEPDKRGGHHRARINIETPRELRAWAEIFEVTPEEVQEAVSAVGGELAKVEMYLAVRMSRKTPHRADTTPPKP